MRSAAVGLVGLLGVVGCAGQPASREQAVVDAIANDNYVWTEREPALVAMKLRKMQRGPYEWMRGTASLYWRDLTEPGSPRAATAFGDPRSSRVLVVGDPHPENVGTFRAADGTMFVDWNDFDATGYGPYTGDLRRLAAGLVIAAHADAALGDELARAVATGYATQIAALAGDSSPAALVEGVHSLLDSELRKARTRGDAHRNLDEFAPVVDGKRVVAFGDLEPTAPDGVIEDRIEPAGAEAAAFVDRAIASWRVGRLDAAAATVKLRARRIGSGVSSYAVRRYDAVLEGASPAVEDDLLVELKETRDGVIVPGIAQREASEWDTPAIRSVDTQRRLQARDDGDVLLGAAQIGGLSFKVRDREAYQRGLSHEDLAALAAGDATHREELRALAALLGGALARAHGEALTADGVRGVTVIAPLLASREVAFADEVATVSVEAAAQITADHARFVDRDLFALIAGAP